MSAELYGAVWRTATELARGGLRLGITLTEGALSMMRSAERSLSDGEAPSAEAKPATPPPGPAPEEPAATGAVARDRTVQDDHVVCLEDGKRFKTLKRHLRLAHGMTPKQYREKWGLAADHPLVAPTYSAKRASVAQKSGLGEASRRRTARRSPRQATTAA